MDAMDSGPVERSGRAPVPYRIVVRGQLTERFTDPLEGVVIESAGIQSVLRVDVVDQAKLQGILGGCMSMASTWSAWARPTTPSPTRAAPIVNR